MSWLAKIAALKIQGSCSSNGHWRISDEEECQVSDTFTDFCRFNKCDGTIRTLERVGGITMIGVYKSKLLKL